MNIYYYSDNYPEQRCCINISTTNTYIDINSDTLPLNLIEHFIRVIIGIISKIHKEKTPFHYFYFKRNGVLHSFNYTVHGGIDWICTFESITPRVNDTRSFEILRKNTRLKHLTYKGIKDLASSHCKAVLALSEATMNIEKAFLANYATGVEYSIIMNKLHVLHPPQEALISYPDIDSKYTSVEKLTFIFVGNDFFRKGGAEIIDVLSSLRDQYDFHLIVVSNLSFNDYATKSTHQSMLYYKQIIQDSKWIEWYNSIDNFKVLELCRHSHIGLLPTFADTYGYSVLEMQACGCPVITTDIRSLPEINNNDCGWIIHLPQNQFKEAYYDTFEQRNANHIALDSQLKDIVNQILNMDPSDICYKAKRSLCRILEEHSPSKYSQVIDELCQKL